MEKIDEQLNNLALVNVPFQMHQSTMHKVNYWRLRPIFFGSFILLIFNLVLTIWRINNKLIDAEFFDMMHDFLDSFVWSFSFISTIIESFFEIISPVIFVSLILNLIGVIYIGKKIKTFMYGII